MREHQGDLSYSQGSVVLRVRGQVGELAVAVHDLPDSSVAAGGAVDWTGRASTKKG